MNIEELKRDLIQESYSLQASISLEAWSEASENANTISEILYELKAITEQEDE